MVSPQISYSGQIMGWSPGNSELFSQKMSFFSRFVPVREQPDEGERGRGLGCVGHSHPHLLELLPFSHVSGVPRQRGMDEDVEEQHTEDIVERKAVFALASGVHRHSLSGVFAENKTMRKGEGKRGDSRHIFLVTLIERCETAHSCVYRFVARKCLPVNSTSCSNSRSMRQKYAGFVLVAFFGGVWANSEE